MNNSKVTRSIKRKLKITSDDRRSWLFISAALLVFMIFTRIGLPLSKTVLAVMAINTFMSARFHG